MSRRPGGDSHLVWAPAWRASGQLCRCLVRPPAQLRELVPSHQVLPPPALVRALSGRLHCTVRSSQPITHCKPWITMPNSLQPGCLCSPAWCSHVQGSLVDPLNPPTLVQHVGHSSLGSSLGFCALCLHCGCCPFTTVIARRPTTHNAINGLPGSHTSHPTSYPRYLLNTCFARFHMQALTALSPLSPLLVAV